ncbi:MAG: hypothetical protein RIC95_05045 [Vicingaceae bacterium]
MKKLVAYVYISWLISLALVGCKHDPVDEVLPTSDQTTNNSQTPSSIPCDPDTAYFQVDVLPILSSNCAFSGCHGNGSSSDGVELSNYINVISTADVRAGNPNGSDLYEVITETDLAKRMPLGSPALPPEDIATIRKWIEQGALNNTCDNCDTTNVTFSLNVKPIIDANCKGCHNGSNPQTNVLLTNYSEIESRASLGELVGAIKHESGYVAMPLNQAKLDQCLISQIEIWVNDGAPNN